LNHPFLASKQKVTTFKNSGFCRSAQ